jgi:hypothetical protein
MSHDANPLPGSVEGLDGAPLPAGATAGQYPLTARCHTCDLRIALAAADATWTHLSDEPFAAYIDRLVTERAPQPHTRPTFYVRRFQARRCDYGNRPSTCYHVPRCRVRGGVFGYWKEAWTGPMHSAVRAIREAAAWRNCEALDQQSGNYESARWEADVRPSTTVVRDAVKAWDTAKRRPVR